MQRSIWVGGFAVGALLGIVILESGPPMAVATAPPSLPATNLAQANTAAYPVSSGPVQPQQPLPTLPTAYEQMVAQIAASQGGRISVGQIAAIASATRSQPGSPTYEQLVAQVAAMQGGRISIGQMHALRGVSGQPSAGYLGAPMYGPAINPAISVGIAQPLYGSTHYQDVRGPATRGADAGIASQMSGPRFSSVGAPPTAGPGFQSPSSQGLIDSASGQYMPPAAGGYTDPRNGIFYAQSGPNGVVNTQTGEFIPTH